MIQRGEEVCVSLKPGNPVRIVDTTPDQRRSGELRPPGAAMVLPFTTTRSRSGVAPGHAVGLDSINQLSDQPGTIPESCIKRFFRTLKEQLLWIRPFHDVAELQEALRIFKDTYNRSGSSSGSASVHHPSS
jgi:hypothetical protein